MSEIINKTVLCGICITGAYSMYTIYKCILKKIKKDYQIAPPGTNELDGTSCWKCEGNGYRKVKKGKKIKCKICDGTGHIYALKRQKHYLDPGFIRPNNKWPAGYKIPGVKSRGIDGRKELYPRNGEMLSNICGDWKIYQRIGGHRFTSDDVCAAYVAIRSVEKYKVDLKESLDMGCGLGTVLLFTAFEYENINCYGIEAQEISYDLCRRSLLYNGIDNRCKVYNGDLRDENILKDKKFQLITGTPPYFIVKRGTVLPAKVDQKACLCEFRGGVEDYCKSAKRYLDKNGIFVIVGSSYRLDRFENGSKDNGLKIIERYDFIGREGKPPLFSVCVMKHAEEVDDSKDGYEINTLIIRDKNANRTKEYGRIMDRLGFPPDYK